MATRFEKGDAAEVQPPIGRRAAARARLQVRACLETTTGELPVIIRNLSQTGAMLQGRSLPKPDRPALLKRGDIEAMGYVVWLDGDCCGFHFYEPISYEEVVAETRNPPEAPILSTPSYGAGVADVISLDDWLRTKARATGQRRSIRSLS